MLLFWPCSWGLTIAYDFTQREIIIFLYLFLFFLGSVLMRSAGCIINDIADRNYDAIKFNEQKIDQLLQVKFLFFEVFIFRNTMLYCINSFIKFNYFTILLALGSMPLAFTYPLMKRFTYWPQLFLGITFNYGLILGWTSIKDEIDFIPIIFYFGAIFWTLGYDTIYGYQDIKDDEIIGLKSTSIKFKNNPIKFITLCYFTFFNKSFNCRNLFKLNNFFYFVFLLIILQMIFFQLKKLNTKDSAQMFKIFKSNNFLGLLVYISLIVGKI